MADDNQNENFLQQLLDVFRDKGLAFPQALIELIRGSKPDEVDAKVASYIRDNESSLSPAVCSLVAATLEDKAKKSGSSTATDTSADAALAGGTASSDNKTLDMDHAVAAAKNVLGESTNVPSATPLLDEKLAQMEAAPVNQIPERDMDRHIGIGGPSPADNGPASATVTTPTPADHMMQHGPSPSDYATTGEPPLGPDGQQLPFTNIGPKDSKAPIGTVGSGYSNLEHFPTITEADPNAPPQSMISGEGNLTSEEQSALAQLQTAQASAAAAGFGSTTVTTADPNATTPFVMPDSSEMMGGTMTQEQLIAATTPAPLVAVADPPVPAAFVPAPTAPPVAVPPPFVAAAPAAPVGPVPSTPNEAYAAMIYKDYLGRDISDGEMKQRGFELDSGQLSKNQFAIDVGNSQEAANFQNNELASGNEFGAVVNQMFHDYVGVDADDASQRIHGAAMKHGASIEDIRKELLDSPVVQAHLASDPITADKMNAENAMMAQAVQAASAAGTYQDNGYKPVSGAVAVPTLDPQHQGIEDAIVQFSGGGLSDDQRTQIYQKAFDGLGVQHGSVEDERLSNSYLNSLTPEGRAYTIGVWSGTIDPNAVAAPAQVVSHASVTPQRGAGGGSGYVDVGTTIPNPPVLGGSSAPATGYDPVADGANTAVQTPSRSQMGSDMGAGSSGGSSHTSPPISPELAASMGAKSAPTGAQIVGAMGGPVFNTSGPSALPTGYVIVDGTPYKPDPGTPLRPFGSP